MRILSIATLANSELRRAAERLDKQAGIGNGDGKITATEIDKALGAAAVDPPAAADLEALQAIKTLLAHYGQGDAATGAVSAGGFRPHTIRGADIKTNIAPLHLSGGSRPNSISRHFDVRKQIPAGQSVLVPLDQGQLHMVELRYHDTRKVRDLEMNYRAKGELGWKSFRGEQWFEMERREKAGEIEIKREPDHNGPWINNPVRVKVEVLYPDGRVHDMGKKLVDFQIHDARSVDGPGSAETDNIYKQLPSGELPPGSLMRLTPYFENQKPWEKEREVAIDFQWVRPISFPAHKEKVRVFSSGSFTAPPAEGYAVDPDRKIAAVMVTWTDNGGYAKGSVSVTGPGGTLRSGQYNIGSGETELIPVDGYAKDGRLRVHGHGIHPVQVRAVQVLYAE